jgi:hypothetical protein
MQLENEVAPLHALFSLCIFSVLNLISSDYREVWPENDSFGSAGLSPEEEFIAVREIFMADIQSEYKEYYQ